MTDNNGEGAENFPLPLIGYTTFLRLGIHPAFLVSCGYAAHLRIQNAQVYIDVVVSQPAHYCADGNLHGFLFGVTVNAGGNQGEGNGPDAQLPGQGQRILVAAVQL